VESVDFIDKQKITELNIGQNPGQIARFLNLRTARNVDLRAESATKDVGQGRLSESRGTTQKDMIQGVSPLLGSLNHQHETVFDFFLTTKFVKIRRPQALIKFRSRSLVCLTVKILAHDSKS
jgi:hypothetical protein